MYSSGETHFGMGTVVKVKKTNHEKNSLRSRCKTIILVLALAVNLTQLRVNGGLSIGRTISLACDIILIANRCGRAEATVHGILLGRWDGLVI